MNSPENLKLHNGEHGMDNKMSLGSLNPLLFPPDINRQPQIVDAIRMIAEQLAAQYGGRHPDEYGRFSIPALNGSLDRIIAKFHVDALTPEQYFALEALVEQTYNCDVRGPRAEGVTRKRLVRYPRIELPDKAKPSHSMDRKKLGWYLGPSLVHQPDCTDPGVLVYRDIGSKKMANYLEDDSHWFFEPNVSTLVADDKVGGYTIELRDGTMSQADIVALIAQIGAILETSKPIQDKQLLAHAYKLLYSLSVPPVNPDQLQGLERQLTEIDRRMFLPLRHPAAGGSVNLHPRSILMCGVPGTGKTLSAESFFIKHGALVFPIDVAALIEELYKAPEKQKLFDRIQRIEEQTGMRIVVQVDDAEKLAEDDRLRVQLMNLMSGTGRHNVLFLASTNKPEAFNSQLIQSDRFVMVYYGLPPQEAREAILRVHVQPTTKRGVPLYQDPGEREEIIKLIARDTPGYTPRLLEDINNTAISYYFARLEQELRRDCSGLTDEDLRQNPMTEEDWYNGAQDVHARYNIGEIEKADRQIRAIVEVRNREMGFPSHAKANGRFKRK